LQQVPDVDRPSIRAVAHPSKPHTQLWLVQGRDANDTAAALSDWLQAQSTLESKVLDRSRWVRTWQDELPWHAAKRKSQGEVLLSDLRAATPEQRMQWPATPGGQAFALPLPVDLSGVGNARVPITLKFKPPPSGTSERVSLWINGALVASQPVTQTEGFQSWTMSVPFGQAAAPTWTSAQTRRNGLEPGRVNVLEWVFDQAVPSESRCVAPVGSAQLGDISLASSLDFSQVVARARPLSLRDFWTQGFPFTHEAGLRNTWFVLPEHAQAIAWTLFLNTLLHLGEQDAAPLTNLLVTQQPNTARVPDKHLIHVHANTPQVVQAGWQGLSPASRPMTNPGLGLAADAQAWVTQFTAPSDSRRVELHLGANSVADAQLLFAQRASPWPETDTITLTSTGIEPQAVWANNVYSQENEWQRSQGWLLERPWLLGLVSACTALCAAALGQGQLKRLAQRRLS